MDVHSHLDFYQLISVLKQLKPEPDVFKDYIFPVVTLTMSAVLGWAIASYSFRRQEDLQIEKEKLLNANRWTLWAEHAFHDLLTLKTTYVAAIGDNTSPLLRTILVKPLRTNAKLIDGDYSGLSFIFPDARAKESDVSEWSDIHRIRSMFENYNLAIETWKFRDSLMQEILEVLFKKVPAGTFFVIDEPQIMRDAPQKDLSAAIMMTEQLIKLTDGLLIELFNFTVHFPFLVSQSINLKRLRRYGKLAGNFNADFELIAEKNLIRTLEPDYKWLSKYMHKSEQDVIMSLQSFYDFCEVKPTSKNQMDELFNRNMSYSGRAMNMIKKMMRKDSLSKLKVFIEKNSILIIVCIAATVLISLLNFVLVEYNSTFGNPFNYTTSQSYVGISDPKQVANAISAVKAEWGQYGDYMGGLVNPIIGFFSFFILCCTIILQGKQLAQSSEELRLTRQELIRGQKIQEDTEATLKAQIGVSVYSRDISNSIALYENLEDRIARVFLEFPILKDIPTLRSIENIYTLHGYGGFEEGQVRRQAEAAILLIDSIKRKNEIRHLLDHEHSRLIREYAYLNQGG